MAPRNRTRALPLRRRLSLAALVAAAVSVAAALPVVDLPASAATGGTAISRSVVTGRLSYAANPTNPLSGRAWGNYTGPQERVYALYESLSGTDRTLVGKVALQPKSHWFGSWTPDDEIATTIRKYLDNANGGDPNVLVSMSIFRMVPWEQEIKTRMPTAAEIASYKTWIDNCAAAIGADHVALILQPDGPFALAAPRPQVAEGLIAYAAKRFAQQPNTSVYIEVGSQDWLFKPYRAANLLIADGVRYVRGFALNATHYDSTVNEVHWGAQIVNVLNQRGIANKHFVVDTAENGRPFTYQQFHGTGSFNNAAPCTTTTELRCVTLGIPPTWQVADPQWRLPDWADALAARLVDGYIWFGRPYLKGQTYGPDLQRILAMARTTPFQ